MCECTAAGIQWEEIGKKIDIFEENISLFFYYNYFMAFHIPRCPSFHKSLNAH